MSSWNDRRALALLVALTFAGACGQSGNPASGASTGSPAQAEEPKTIPRGVAAGSQGPEQSQGAARRYAFHINFIIDEQGSCPATVKCDVPYVPRSVLYFRGNLSVQPDRSVEGDGTMTFLDVQPCRTLMPDASSCSVTPASAGTFAVTGRVVSDPSAASRGTLQLTMKLKELPRLSATMTTTHPSGPVKIPFDTTYAHLLKSLFTNAKVFDAPFEVSPTFLTGGVDAKTAIGAGHTFEGTYSQTTSDKSVIHTIHGLGGLFFIPPGTLMPAPESGGVSGR